MVDKNEICVVHGCYQAFRDKEKTFFIISTKLITALMPNYRDLVIFMVIDDRWTKPITLLLAHVCGKYTVQILECEDDRLYNGGYLVSVHTHNDVHLQK